MRVAIITFPGSNCDYDCYKALTDVIGVEAYFVWHREKTLAEPDAVILPGGFSYGDYLRAGAIARFSPIMPAVIEFARAGGPTLGICNGFQILCEAHLLPGALIRNESLKFAGQPIYVRVENAETMFTNAYRKGDVLKYHVAHGMGNFVADDRTIAGLEAEGRVIFRYVTRDGEVTEAANPNGATNNIAGISNEAGNILGLMPHPERAVEALLGSTDGVGLFESMRRHIENGAEVSRPRQVAGLR
ncbi:MAG TPA: phosphoribosylformylglycinamidine synthase subunit PurQ [Longimicrobiales bacterium]|nr:phosphoribosylformylglycinamidine synthase subunit PurQ [Longimicrobiales bacterium]